MNERSLRHVFTLFLIVMALLLIPNSQASLADHELSSTAPDVHPEPATTDESKSDASLIAAQDASDASSDEINQVKARKLSGAVHMAAQKETALSRVLIEECDPSWSRVLGSTKTDYQGNFSLKPARKGKIHYLRLSAKGFYTRHYEVTLSSDAPEKLKLELQLSSRSQGSTGRARQNRFFLS